MRAACAARELAPENSPDTLSCQAWRIGGKPPRYRAVHGLIFSALIASLTSCATVSTLDANKAGAPVVYAGTRLDYYLAQGGCCPQDRFGTDGPKYPAWDMPGSMLLDTLLLPLSLLTAAGIGFSAQGGL